MTHHPSTESTMLTFLNQLANRRRFGMKPGLSTMQRLMEKLGHPEQGIAAIHIAGTNGKGSVAALCESVLRAAGYAVGRYTSPHLLRVNERFLVRGIPATDAMLQRAADEVDRVVHACETAGDEVTYFEYLTALAFVLYRNEQIKLVVLETGLGGRLDATNVCLPLVSVITRIGLDHCDWLGDTLAKIAAEKAGIIKPGRPVVVAPMPEEAQTVIAAVAARQAATLIDATESVSVSVRARDWEGQTLRIATQEETFKPIRLPLVGAYQVENVCTALAALTCVAQQGLAIPEEAYHLGLSTVCWPGRFQVVRRDPLLIVDGAHNPDGATALREALHALNKGKSAHKVALIAGFCGDKDVLSYLRVLASTVHSAWAVPVPNPRSLTADETAGKMRMAGIDDVQACATLEESIVNAEQWARANEGLIVISGSLFLAGAALEALNAFPWSNDRHDLSEQLKS